MALPYLNSGQRYLGIADRHVGASIIINLDDTFVIDLDEQVTSLLSGQIDDDILVIVNVG